MIERMTINTFSKTYPVLIGNGAILELESFMKNMDGSFSKLMLITDETVANLHIEYVKSIIQRNDLYIKIVPSGEKAKTFDVYYDCLSAALEYRLDRHSLILSFGGGAVGDLAGFVAATYMRGIRFIQIPTTILAHDSAVGGKVAINHPLGKNMIGAFHQPEAVLYDLDFLQTLPSHEVRSGFAEVVKHALISDEHFYQLLLHKVNSLSNFDQETMSLFLKMGMKVKAEIVEKDEQEKDIRAFLNFGHTLGHGIEAEVGYGNITHGEAVIIGMLFALRLSIEKLGLTFNYIEFEEWLRKIGYKTTIPEGVSVSRLIERMKQDKKAIQQNIRFVLLNRIGSPEIMEVDEKCLFHKLNLFKEMREI